MSHLAPAAARPGQLIGWLLGRYKRVRVQGQSMAPTLSEGAVVLVDLHVSTRQKSLAGEIVVARHPYRKDTRLLKRVDHVLSDGRCFLIGDAPGASTDSRSFGAVPVADVLGVVVARFGD